MTHQRNIYVHAPILKIAHRSSIFGDTSLLDHDGLVFHAGVSGRKERTDTAFRWLSLQFVAGSAEPWLLSGRFKYNRFPA